MLRLYSDFNYIESIIAPADLENRSVEVVLSDHGNQFKLFPNPASDFCIFERWNDSNRCTLLIADITGKTIGELKLGENQQQVTIEMSSYASGTYLLKVQDVWGAVVWTSTIIKQ